MNLTEKGKTYKAHYFIRIPSVAKKMWWHYIFYLTKIILEIFYGSEISERRNTSWYMNVLRMAKSLFFSMCFFPLLWGKWELTFQFEEEAKKSFACCNMIQIINFRVRQMFVNIKLRVGIFLLTWEKMKGKIDPRFENKIETSVGTYG